MGTNNTSEPSRVSRKGTGILEERVYFGGKVVARADIIQNLKPINSYMVFFCWKPKKLSSKQS